MTMLIALHPRDDIGRLYESKKEEGRRFDSIEDGVNRSIRRHKDDKKKKEKNKERLITATRNSTDNIKINRATTNEIQK